jgi:hypothetical protein
MALTLYCFELRQKKDKEKMSFLKKLRIILSFNRVKKLRYLFLFSEESAHKQIEIAGAGHMAMKHKDCK